MPAPETAEPEIGGSEIAALQEQVAQGELGGLRSAIARMREQSDWQERFFTIDRVVPKCPLNVLDKACEAEPEAADVHLLRCAFFSYLASEMRGAKRADQTSDAQFYDAAHCIKDALRNQKRAIELDPKDPTTYAFVMRPLTIFGELQPNLRTAYQVASRLAPAFVMPHFLMVNAESARWGGSHEKSLIIARNAMLNARPGSDMAACLFWAHILVWSHLLTFDKDKAKAAAYRQVPGIKKELESAFDQWTGGGYQPRRSSIVYFHYAAFWFYAAADKVRLRKALELAQGLYYPRPWGVIGIARDVYAKALAAAAAV